MKLINKDKYENLLNEIRECYPESIKDGPVDWEKYENNRIKILWILREPNGGDSWDLRDHLGISKNFFGYERWASTYGLVAKVSNGLLNDLEPEKIDFNDKNEVIDWLKNIAVINVNKTSGGSRINNSYYKNRLKYVDFVDRQIELLQPNIILAVKDTVDVIPSMKHIQTDKFEATSFSSDNQYLVKINHPSYRNLTHQESYRKIREALKRAI